MRLAASRLLLVIGLALPLAWWCWRIGQRTAQPEPIPRSFRVQGSSMVPTLFGPSRAAFCPACRFLWQVETPPSVATSADVAASRTIAEAIGLNCAHCGGPMSIAPNRDQPVGQRVRIETVSEIEATGDSMRRGDLVAVRHAGQLHIKRVVGLPGETIQVQGARLLVDSQRPEDRLQRVPVRFPLPWILVDDDARRAESRWSMEPPDEGVGAWTRDPARTWHTDGTGSPSPRLPSPWLRYGHRSVDRGQLATPIWDDVPFNVTLARKLFVVDRLRLRGESPAAGACEVAFWREDGNVLVRRTLQQHAEFVIDCFEGEPRDALPVSKQHPVAIRLLDGQGSLQGLRIERLIEYRLRPHDDRSPYPLRLGRDQWFVLGDNVPVSVDGRQWGPLSSDQLLGRLQRIESTPREMVEGLP